MNTVILWFKNDLRLDDNPALAAAAQAERLLCVYVIDSRHHADSEYGPPKLGRHRKAFLRQSLIDLRERIEVRGGRLVIVAGEAEEQLARLAATVKADRVVTMAESAPEERAVLVRVSKALGDVPLETREGGGLYQRQALPFDLADMPRVFTKFRKAVETEATIEARIATPSRLPSPPALNHKLDNLPDEPHWPDTQCPFTGGESAGLARLGHYIWQQQAVAHYKETRNQLQGEDFSSKFSPWLALGGLSPRRIMTEVARFEQEVVANQSTYWLGFELHWREFFRWTLAKHGSRLFHLGGLLERDDRPTNRDPALIAAWQQGRTGMPFVDANMRELAETGSMSNRGRQNTASFFARDLGQDWRLGAAWFESQLVDYDVASNWGNWANVAGVGTDKRDKGFNVLAQARRYDGDAEYVSHWLPELNGMPRADRQHPFFVTSDARVACDYPRLVIEPPRDWQR